MEAWEERKKRLFDQHQQIISRKNTIDSSWDNGIYKRYQNCVLTREHIPLDWRYDFNQADNPYLMERIGVNAVFNSGALFHDGKYVLIARVEGYDRKSYFAVARSDSPVDGFQFDAYPIRIPQLDADEMNVYDMRITRHQDGWIYGFFCSERKDKTADDLSSAVAKCGIVRTKNLTEWERLPDAESRFQQRNVVLHPEFSEGKYLFYTRPSDGFIDVGGGGGIGCARIPDITHAKITDETIIDRRYYHTIKEAKNGAGAPPIRTAEGWIHIAHGVRGTAAGLRYVLYCFMTDLEKPDRVIYAPGGHLIAPMGAERVGDVSNVVFCNGAIEHDGSIYIYYASSDTRLHVAETTVDRLVDYCKHTPSDGLSTHRSVESICRLIDKNADILK